ncbi:MAG: 5-formyltetrahydrofolate cyclo-ligase [Phycisphaeraceae bacterium]
MTLDSPTDAKNALRQVMLRRRAAVAAEQAADWSRRIVACALEMVELRSAASVFVYVSVGREAATAGLIEALLERGLIVAVPRVIGPGLIEPHHIASLAQLEPGKYGIPAPTSGEMLAGAPDICFAPAVAVTERGQRMGMGGGYYDRYLATHRPGATVALCYEMQVVPDMPTEPTDRPVDAVVTERRVVRM